MPDKKTIWSVGGGKGGVGKSIATANIGCALAQRGKEVVLVDADLGGANLHTYFGIKHPEKGLDDFLKGRAESLEDTAVETDVKGLRLITGGGEFLGIANPAFAQKQKLISHIKALKADFILVDLGAGSTYNILDFFAVSNEGIVVLVPEPAAIQNAYIFLKSFVYRRLQRLFADNEDIARMVRDATDARSGGAVKTFSDLCEKIASRDRDAARSAITEIKSFRPRVLLNMAASREDLKVVDAFRSAATAFLSLDTDFIGVLYSRPSVKAAARRMRPFMCDKSADDAHRDMAGIIEGLLRGGEEAVAEPPSAREDSEAQEVFGYNDNVSHSGAVYHVQTEVQGGGAPSIETIIYCGGRIFFSKKSLWNEIAKSNGALEIKDFATRQHRAAMAAIKMDKITLKG
ncbi:MAG: P-loop NTPase [Deltaproteobacteria bacterium]|nr:P-loop NTPase [Deltaproteobacteria bacterium]